MWGLLVPLVVCGYLIAILRNNNSYDSIRTWCYQRIAEQTALQCLGVIVGILIGRKLARGVVRMVIPPKPRQMLAFLWQVDGKQMPGIRFGE